MDKLQKRYSTVLKLDTSNQELSDLIATQIDQLTEDQMIELIMRIDSSYGHYSLISWFQDNPCEFFIPHDKLWWVTPYQLIQDDPLWWVQHLASFYNLNLMILDD